MSRRFDGDKDKQDEETLGSYYMGRMRPPPENGRVMPRGLIAGVVIVAFAGLLWYAYPRGQEAFDNADVPLIKADTTAYKSKPEDPGGMEVRHQDSTVFNPLVNKSADEVEHLLPRPEEPMNKDDALTSTDTQAPSVLPDDKAGMNLELQEDAAEGAEKVVSKDAADEDRTLTEMATAPAVVEEPIKEEAVKTANAEPVKAEEKPVEKTVQAPAAKAAEPEKPAAVASGAVAGYYMQLGSFRDPSGAQEEWRKLQRKFPQSLSPLSSRVERADLAAKGIWYRLYAGPVPEAKAKDICGRLKADNGSGCIVRKL